MPQSRFGGGVPIALMLPNIESPQVLACFSSQRVAGDQVHGMKTAQLPDDMTWGPADYSVVYCSNVLDPVPLDVAGTGFVTGTWHSAAGRHGTVPSERPVRTFRRRRAAALVVCRRLVWFQHMATMPLYEHATQASCLRCTSTPSHLTYTTRGRAGTPSLECLAQTAL